MAAFVLPVSRWFYQGVPASNGTVTVYQTGTTTPVTIYTDGALTTPASNPITLDSNGECKFYVGTAFALKLVVATSGGTLIETVDPVYPVTGASNSPVAVSKTLAAGAAATFVLIGEAASAPTASDMGLSTLAGVFYHDTSNNLVEIRDQADTTWMPFMLIDEAGKLAGAKYLAGSILPPGGRLTLASGVPVMIADATAQSNVYYTPYGANTVPIYDGLNFFNYTFAEMTMALDASAQAAGSLYDLFGFLNAGVVMIGAGPAWASTTGRGTLAGTTAIQNLGGIYVNQFEIALNNGSNSYSAPAYQATYLGTIHATGNGQTGMMFRPAALTGGPANILAVYNAYNRVTVTSLCRDDSSSWTYSTSAWRPANGSDGNRVTFVDGLQRSFVRAAYSCTMAQSSTSVAGLIAVGLDSGSAEPSGFAANTTVDTALAQNAWDDFAPQLGLHFVQAMEYSSGATSSFQANGLTQALRIELEM